MKGNNRRIVCIFGAARSGTSVTAHLVYAMGTYFGDNKKLMLPADGINPEGFFERMDVGDINAKIVKMLGGDSEIYALPQDWKVKTKDLEVDIRNIVRELSQKPISAIKNNPMSVLFPIWDEMFREEGLEASYIHIVRHPAEVAQSSYKWTRISEGNCLYTWFCRNRSAMQAAKHGAYKMVVYENLMRNPADVVEEIARFLDIDANVRNIAMIPKTDLYHNRKIGGDSLQDDLYGLLLGYGEAASKNDCARMAEFEGKFSSYEPVLASMYDPNDMSMALSCKVEAGDVQFYSGSANWGTNDTFSFCKSYETALTIHAPLLVTLATQAFGKCYGAYYEILNCKVNHKICQVVLKRQPTIRNLNMQFEIATDDKEISAFEVSGKVKLIDYPSWYRWGRKIMPLRLRDFLRKIGVRKVYGK